MKHSQDQKPAQTVARVAACLRPRIWTCAGLAVLTLGSATGADDADPVSTRRLPKRLPVVAQPAKPNATPVSARINRETLASPNTHSPQINPLAGDDGTNAVASSARTDSRAEETAPTRWLRSTTSSAAAEVSRRLLTQASQEYDVRAWLSAETTAWDALHWAAQGVDLASRENGKRRDETTAIERLQFAKHAIREARDFSGSYGEIDAEAIARMARSHETDVLDDKPTDGLSAADASDLYLDEARVKLATIASQSVEAAQAMDLLAAIHLSRAEARTLPSATALCLRRAALQGQPGNASLASRLGMHLADVGLLDESRWALEHSLSIEHDPQAAEALVRVLRRTGHDDQAAGLIAQMRRRVQAGPVAPTQPARPRIPQVTELSPADFAALSKPVMPVSRKSGIVPASLASSRQPTVKPVVDSEQEPTAQESVTRPAASELTVIEPDEKPGVVRRIMNTFKRGW